MYLVTNQDAPLYKVVSVDLAFPQLRFVDVVPEDKEALLSQYEAVGEHSIALIYKRKVSCRGECLGYWYLISAWISGI